MKTPSNKPKRKPLLKPSPGHKRIRKLPDGSYDA
jgi:hypothetical protein